jgi:CheY-like chemotaxis protein
MMGGKLSVESEPKHGSIFKFTVPTSQVESGSQTPVQDCASLRGIPVLVIDDNATNRRLLSEWLTQWGMWPILAESGAAALKLLESLVQPVPLVLTDVHMPEMDGFELIERIKTHSKTPTIIMLTSGSYAGDVTRSRELGAEAYLIKPLRRSELLETILRVLAAHPPISDPVATWPESIRRLGKQLRVPPSGQLRVLVAEDNIVNQKYILNVLEQEGYSAAVVGNGREALAALEREHFDLVLMDLQMPDMDGFEATSSIRARERFTGTRIPIVAVTAHAMSGDRDKSLAAGMDAYIAKPIRRADLLEAIVRLTSASRSGVGGPDGSKRTSPVLAGEDDSL